MFNLCSVLALATVAVAYPQLVSEVLDTSPLIGVENLIPEVENGTESPLGDLAALADSIPGGGVPGEDYPILSSLPETGFSCEDQEAPGYYADDSEEARCQIFHICQFDGRQDSFLCPNGTLFNQQYFVCDWWYNVDCSATQEFLSLNFEFGKIAEDQTQRTEVVTILDDAELESNSAVTESSNTFGLRE